MLSLMLNSLYNHKKCEKRANRYAGMNLYLKSELSHIATLIVILNYLRRR